CARWNHGSYDIW
nr:immunoglobulin heavy chain junction region [Macaca mulatta]MOW27082.1 immunoglobulin heavy chain junction region [Macaca mulatta]